MYKYSRRQIVVIGSSYIVAVFLAYLLIGLGFANVIYAASFVRWLIRGFYIFLAVVCITLGIMSLYDAWSYSRRRKSQEQLLQLPKFLKKMINKVIGTHLRHKQKSSYWGLIAASFIVGILVSILESACTGQIYLPVLSIILRNYGLKLRALEMLIVYNLMFIVPLVGVFLIALLGTTSDSLSGFLKKYLGQIKFLMGVLFFLMAYLILGH